MIRIYIYYDNHSTPKHTYDSWIFVGVNSVHTITPNPHFFKKHSSVYSILFKKCTVFVKTIKAIIIFLKDNNYFSMVFNKFGRLFFRLVGPVGGGIIYWVHLSRSITSTFVVRPKPCSRTTRHVLSMTAARSLSTRGRLERSCKLSLMAGWPAGGVRIWLQCLRAAAARDWLRA